VAEWLLLAEAWCVLFGFYLALRWMSYDRLNTFISQDSKESTNSYNPFIFAERLKRLVEISSHLHLLPMTCLVKSSALSWMLVQRGVPIQLRIGVGKTLTGIYAHAWVELKGVPVGEAGDITERFKILAPLEHTLISDLDTKLI
jgi:hypothetical protein